MLKNLRKHKKNHELLGQVQRIVENIEQAEAVSELTNFKQLKAECRYFRIRIGEYRIGVTLEKDLVILIRVLHKKRFIDSFLDAFFKRSEDHRKYCG